MKISELINFRVLPDSVATPYGVAQFLRILPPNLSIMTQAERLAQIEKLESLLDAATIPFQIFITDKTEDLSANKAFYRDMAQGSDYGYLIDHILKSMETVESDSSAVQRSYYLVAITKEREDFTTFYNLVADLFSVYQVKDQELTMLLRNFLLREFFADLHSFEEEVRKMAEKSAGRWRRGKVDFQELYDLALTKRLTPQRLTYTPQHVVQNDFLRKTILIKNFPSSIDIPCFLSGLSQIKNTTMSIRLSQMNEQQAGRLVDNQMNNISAKGHGSKTSQQIQAEVEGESVTAFYKSLAENNSKLYNINIYIELYASSQKELRTKWESVKSKLSAFRITTESLTYEQKEGFLGVYPLGREVLGGSANNMPSPTIAGMFPLSHSSRNDPEGMPLGKTADGGHMYLDFWLRTLDITNGNFSITGDSGQGKSWLMKKIITFMMLRGITCFTLDPDGEYCDLFHHMGGTVIDCAAGNFKINPFEVRRMANKEADRAAGMEESELGAFTQDAVFFQHLSWLRDFFGVLFPAMSSNERNALMILTQDMYRSFGITEHTDFQQLPSTQYPTFSSLYEFVENVQQHPGNHNYPMIGDEMLRSLLLYLRDTYDGSLGFLLNGHTNIIRSRMINFDISQLRTGSEERTQAVLFNIMTYCWNRISLRQEQVLFNVDELHLLMSRKNFTIAGYLRDFQKRARKYNAVIGSATQSLGDFLDPEMMHITAPLFNTSSFKFTFFPGELDKGQIKRLLDLTDGEIGCISTPKQGRCLLKAGSQKYLLHVGELPYEKELFGSGGGK